jgi:hypothetical protein
VEVNGVELLVAAQIVEVVAVLGVELTVGAPMVVAFTMDGGAFDGGGSNGGSNNSGNTWGRFTYFY